MLPLGIELDQDSPVRIVGLMGSQESKSQLSSLGVFTFDQACETQDSSALDPVVTAVKPIKTRDIVIICAAAAFIILAIVLTNCIWDCYQRRSRRQQIGVRDPADFTRAASMRRTVSSPRRLEDDVTVIQDHSDHSDCEVEFQSKLQVEQESFEASSSRKDLA